MTAVAGSVFTAAQFNQYVRDNLNQTATALATASGQLFVATGVNALAARSFTSNAVATTESTSSSTYGTLTTSGPAVTVTTGTAALVALSCAAVNAGAGSSLMGFSVTGSSSVSATDSFSIGVTASSIRTGGVFLVTGLSAGSNIFTALYRSITTTATFSDRKITVLGL